MESTFAGRGAGDDRSIAPGLAPGDMDGDRRAMTLPGPFGAWRRRLRSPAFRAGSYRIGENRSAACRGRGCSGRPGSSGCASAATRGIARAFNGVCCLGRTAVPVLLFLTLLAGVATQASAQTLPTVSFKDWDTWDKASLGERGYSGACYEVILDKAPASDITVKYTLDGSATLGSDFNIAKAVWYDNLSYPLPDQFATVPSGTLTVPAGRDVGYICIYVIDDSVPESSESIILQLVGGSGYQVGSNGKIIFSILANDGPTASFVSASQHAGEGSGTRNVAVRVNGPWRLLSYGTPSDITLSYTVGGTATAGSDYTALSGTLTVPARRTTATIAVPLIDDSVQEGSETVVLTLTAGEGYAVGGSGTHRLTIAANDGPTASFASVSQSASEGSGTHNVAVRLDPAPTADMTLSYTVDGTATAGSDFTIAGSGTVTVLAGRTTAIIPVTLIDDSVYENSETVVLTLVGSTQYQAGSPTTLTILDDDGPTVSFLKRPNDVYRNNEVPDYHSSQA